MLFVLAGPSYVGKKTALIHFMKLYSFSSIIPYTTKPEQRRSGEVEGIKYHYVEKANEGDIKNDNFIFDTPFEHKNQKDDVIYAYKKDDIEQAINSYSNFIIHASVGNAMQIYDLYHAKNKGHIYVVFLNYYTRITEEAFKEKFKRMDARYCKFGTEETEIDEAVFIRRYNHALKECEVYNANKKKFNECVKGDQPYEICEKLQDYILPKLMVMPTSPDRIPGPLSDDDIIYMSEKRKNDMLQIEVNGRKLSVDELKDILCGCGIQLCLSESIRLVKKNALFNYIDMAQEEHELEANLARIYPEQNISTGYVLKPNEVILCSSQESIIMPHDVYAIVSSKFSYTQLGLSIELGTSIIQAGHNGKVHFQIKNNTGNSICIYPGIQVVQLLLFRTVQPSSKKYRDEEGNHYYDKESISPVSRFHKNNEKLLNVSKPGKNWLKTILNGVGNEVVNKLIGIGAVTGIGMWSLSELTNFFEEKIVPIWYESSVVIKCFLIAVFGCIMNSVFKAVGQLTIFLFKKVVDWVREKRR